MYPLPRPLTREPSALQLGRNLREKEVINFSVFKPKDFRLFYSNLDELFTMQPAKADDDEEIQEEEGEDDITPHTAGFASIEALYSLARNSKISDRGNVCAIASSIFLCLALFRKFDVAPTFADNAPEKSAKKTKKKKIKENSELASAIAPIYEMDSLDCLSLIAVNLKDSSGESKTLPEDISRLAGVKLLSLLAEIGNSSIKRLNSAEVPKPEGEIGNEKELESADKGNFLQFLISLLKKLLSSNSASTAVFNDDEIDRTEVESLVESLGKLSQLSLEKQVEKVGGETTLKQARVIDALVNLSTHSLLTALCTESGQIEVLLFMHLISNAFV